MPSLPIANLLGMSPVVQGIRYGDLTFTEPRLFAPALIAPIQGIYAIVVPDIAYKPRQFRLLYLGETADFSKRLTDQHEKYAHWKREANGQALYYAYYMTINWTEQQRKDAECALIKQYNPPCNTMLRSLIAPLTPPVPPLKRFW
jgi:hypothetical protein